MRRYKKDFYQSLLNILVMLLPGGVISYYGDEIGLQDIQLNYEGGVGDSLKQRVEPVSVSNSLFFCGRLGNKKLCQ